MQRNVGTEINANIIILKGTFTTQDKTAQGSLIRNATYSARIFSSEYNRYEIEEELKNIGCDIGL